MNRVREAIPSSVSMCPGCGGSVEMLRAGHVAFLDGGFRYFCSAECKNVWFEAHDKVAAATALTAEPPRVAPSSGARPRQAAPSRGLLPPPPVRADASEPELSPPSDEREPPRTLASPRVPASADVPAVAARDDERWEPAVDPHPADEDATDAAPASAPAAATPKPTPTPTPTPPAVAAAEEVVEEAPVSAFEAFAPPEALSLPDVGPASGRLSLSAPAPAPRPKLLRLHDALSVLAGLLAVLALLAPLAHEQVAAFGAPLAAAAGVAGAAWLVGARRKPRPGVHPLVLAWPLALGSAATASRMLGETALAPGATPVPVAAFTALATLAALFVERFVDGAFAELVERRLRTSTLLARPAVVERDGARVTVEAAAVRTGERVRVRSGEAVPVDGVVVDGADVRPWPDRTSSQPVRAGESVLAGARVTQGELVLVASSVGVDRLVARFHERGGESEIPFVRLLRRGSEIGAPVVGVVAGVAVGLMHGGATAAVAAVAAAGFAVAVVSAPATAGLVFGRAGLAARRRGIFFKDPASFERAGEVGFAVLCSRGTLLLGEPQIVGIEAVGALDEARVLALAAGAELTASHPFAEAVVRAARARGLAPEPVRSVIVADGLGVTALTASGDEVVVGSRALMLRERVAVAAGESAIVASEAQGRSVLFVALAGKLVGLILLQDGLRPGARAAAHRLHEAHVEPVLLSGESRETSETIARSLGIDHVRPEVLPQDRGAEIRALAEGGQLVAVVGHPSRDDAALGAADVAVAMGAPAGGTVEWSVVLAGDDVRDAALALTLSRAARERARGAVLFGMVPALFGVAALAFGLAPVTALPPLGLLGALLGVSWVRDAFRAD